jgi:hypothetical protein
VPNTSGLAVKVGIFVVVGLILLIGFSLRVSEGFGGSDTYSVHGYFDSAVGLEPNAQVSLAGLAIGEVKEIGFDAERRKVRSPRSTRCPPIHWPALNAPPCSGTPPLSCAMASSLPCWLTARKSPPKKCRASAR